ncbi:MAG: hypothetical protein M3Q69_00915 [Acidobacteriota bacterium]|nr:hypothetical protein [Acidobacteriota bacterium]
MSAEAELESVLRGLWPSVTDAALRDLLPHDLASLGDFYPRLQQYVDAAPRAMHGTIDPAAIVRGDVISMGEGSIIEAGAIVHESCRLILGARSVIRAGALLRDEILVGDDCLIGAHSDLARTVLVGPGTALGHSIVFNDSIIGAHVLLSAFVAAANTHLTAGKEISIRTRAGGVLTGRTYLGALIGDGVRIGNNTALAPGTIVMPELRIPQAAVLLGIVDAERREQLMRNFFERWGGES